MRNANLSVSSITRALRTEIPGGIEIDVYALRNRSGMEAHIATYGGIVASLTAPDRNGNYSDVVLGRHSRGLLERHALFRCLDRPLRQPHCQGEVLAQWRQLQARPQ